MANCIICGKGSRYYKLCKKCYEKKEEIKEILKKYITPENALDFFQHKENDLKNETDKGKAEEEAIDLLAIGSFLIEYKIPYGENNDYESLTISLLKKAKKRIEDFDQKKVEFFSTSSMSKNNVNITDDNNEITEEENEDEVYSTSSIDQYHKKYPSKYKCEDGHWVKSRAEVRIDDYLYSHNVLHTYEKKVYGTLDSDKYTIADFYIKEGNFYIEYYGVNKKSYYIKQHIKEKFYERNKINVIQLDHTPENDLLDILEKEIKQKNPNFH